MSDKNKKNKNYTLKSDSVDRLVNAEKTGNAKGPALKDPGKAYRSNFLDKIPAPVKALFLKFWFVGAVCFFVFWGLSFTDSLDAMVIMSVVLGVVADILVDNILRFIEVVPGENAKWMMFPQKRFWTFFANIIYAFLLFFCVRSFYVAINNLGQILNFYLGVEPLLFGIFYMLFDILFVSMKRLMQTIINDAKDKVNKQ